MLGTLGLHVTHAHPPGPGVLGPGSGARAPAPSRCSPTVLPPWSSLTNDLGPFKGFSNRKPGGAGSWPSSGSRRPLQSPGFPRLIFPSSDTTSRGCPQPPGTTLAPVPRPEPQGWSWESSHIGSGPWGTSGTSEEAGRSCREILHKRRGRPPLLAVCFLMSLLFIY